jgi:hypothetical protein
MVSITPCQRLISDRFPVASFVVNAPPERLFEIACATDPTLFRSDQRHRRSASNFFSTRLGGLMRAPAGHATYLMPPDQLKRFAGARRLFYNVGSYAGPRGEDPRFSVPPEAAQAMPSIQISADFTGRTLDRSRLGGIAARADARYGGNNVRTEALTWGADLVAAAPAAPRARLGDRSGGAAATAAAQAPAYDDGYSPDLWKQQRRRAPVARALGGDVTSGASTGTALDEPPGYEDAPDLVAHSGMSLPNQPPPLEPMGEMGRYGGAEPAGFEDGAELNRSRRAGGRRPVLGGAGGVGAPVAAAPSPRAEIAGFEDAPALARGRQRRYGAVGYALDDAPPAGSPAPAAAPPASATATAGRDDDYDDSTDEAEEPEPPADLPGADARSSAAPVPLTIPEKFKLVALVARNEGGGGRDGYSAVNPDGEYNDPSHRFFHRQHVGLSWGIVQFTQLGGALGRVLSACQRRDPAQFAQVFGPDSEELLRVTNADNEDDRLQPVGAQFLWEGDWPQRFRDAGKIPSFQAAQNEVAIEGYLDPNLAFARCLGWNTDRALALLYDRCVQMGNAGARSFIIRAINPIRTQKQRAEALSALGYPNLQAFADAYPELDGDARWTPLCQAALAGALRGLGTESPVPVPALGEQLDRVVAASAGRRFADRVQKLRGSSDLYDVTYQLIG